MPMSQSLKSGLFATWIASKVMPERMNPVTWVKENRVELNNLYGNKGNFESYRDVTRVYHFTGPRSFLMEASTRASSLRDMATVVGRVRDLIT